LQCGWELISVACVLKAALLTLIQGWQWQTYWRLFCPAPLAKLSALAGKSTLSQWGQEPTLISVTFVLFIAASLAPIFNRADGKERLGPFTPTAELINGRAAM